MMVDPDRTEQGPANRQWRLWRHLDLWVTLRVKEPLLLRTATVLKKVQSDKCQVLGHLEIYWGMLSSHREDVARMYIWESPVYRQLWKAKGTEKVWVVTEKNGHPESPGVSSPIQWEVRRNEADWDLQTKRTWGWVEPSFLLEVLRSKGLYFGVALNPWG